MKAARTGGTSMLRHSLEKTHLDIFHFKDHPQRFKAWLRRIDDHHLTEYFVFSFVRNPWDRAVSIACYFGIPFKDFLANFVARTSKNNNLLQHALPLHHYTHLGEKRFTDFIGKFEQLQSDFDVVCDRLDLERQPLRKSSSSKRTNYQTYYDRDAKALVDAIYGRDAELFEYQFDTSKL
ncbi:MAG: sulfotransferase family 2 domain-containing protein [Planctomycetaceae bacterium]|nr:sulfotransferase family 2 domain-containing protein [Planctomycetaceae bacterium]